MKHLMQVLTAAIVSNQISVETARAMVLNARNGQHMPLTVGDPIEPEALEAQEAQEAVEAIEEALAQHSTMAAAASSLGISRSTLYRRLHGQTVRS